MFCWHRIGPLVISQHGLTSIGAMLQVSCGPNEQPTWGQRQRRSSRSARSLPPCATPLCPPQVTLAPLWSRRETGQAGGPKPCATQQRKPSAYPRSSSTRSFAPPSPNGRSTIAPGYLLVSPSHASSSPSALSFGQRCTFCAYPSCLPGCRVRYRPPVGLTLPATPVQCAGFSHQQNVL